MNSDNLQRGSLDGSLYASRVTVLPESILNRPSCTRQQICVQVADFLGDPIGIAMAARGMLCKMDRNSVVLTADEHACLMELHLVHVLVREDGGRAHRWFQLLPPNLRRHALEAGRVSSCLTLRQEGEDDYAAKRMCCMATALTSAPNTPQAHWPTEWQQPLDCLCLESLSLVLGGTCPIFTLMTSHPETSLSSTRLLVRCQRMTTKAKKTLKRFTRSITWVKLSRYLHSMVA